MTGKEDSIHQSLWLALGASAGAIAAGSWWSRQQKARQSPLLTRQETVLGQPLTALVTGASSGLGRVYAQKLAEMGYRLILVARRTDRLETLSAKLTQTYGTEAMVVTADLTTESGIARVEQVIAATPDLNLLVNNAGAGLFGKFAESDLNRHLNLVTLHIQAVIRLVRAALPAMLAQRRGAIINVSSLMAFYPMYGSTSYAGTKCYLRAFSEALHQELMGTGVRVQSLCPGFVETEFQKSAEIKRLRLPDVVWMQPEPVIEQSLRDLAHDRVVSVPGLGYRLLAIASGIIPRPVIYLVGRLVSRSRER